GLQLLPYFLFIASGFTAFYIARLVFKVFVAPTTRPQLAQAHEASRWMRVPMIFLAVCSLFPLFSIHPIDAGQVWITGQLLPATLSPGISALHTLVPVAA